MDAISGAAILAERFSAAASGGIDGRLTCLQAAGALPVFHWVGVEPPDLGDEGDAGGARMMPARTFLDRATRRFRRAGD